MKSSVPWQVRGIRAEARETAREAARRAGMSVGEWLNTVIVQSAIEDGVLPEDIERFSEDDDLAAINKRLDRLTRQLETVLSVARGEPLLAEDPPAPPKDAASMDEAIAEIAARQRALEAEFIASPSIAPPQPDAPPLPREVPMPDISGLERQLQHITRQIELFSRPSGLENEVGSLRQELNEIGRALKEALPKRAVEALETELRAVAQRLDQTRQCGFDPKAVTAIEQGLIEVRDALRTLTPAEKLVGYGDAVNVLSRKIDQMPAGHDPAVLQQLETAIGAIRGAVSNVASNESLTLLAQEVRALSARIDRIDTPTGPDIASEAISSLDKRMGALSEQLDKNAHVASALTPQVEAMLKRYSERFDQAEAAPRGDAVAVNHLEDRIVNLVQKLDASDARLGTLAGIERGLSDLLVRIDELRTQKPTGEEPGLPPAVDALQRDVARTQNTLEGVHGTLGHVVDRLASIEADIRRPVAVAAPVAAAPAPAKAATSQTGRRSTDSALPPDYPLEPGSGAPRSGNPATPAERIAASEAALAPTHAAAGADTPPAIQPNFIAAARRAAQAAAAGEAASDKTGATTDKIADRIPGKGHLSKRLRALLVGAGVIVLVLGGLRIATNLLDQSNEAEIEGSSIQDSLPPGSGELAPAPRTQSSVSPAKDKPVAPLPVLATSPEPEKLPAPPSDAVAPRATPDVTGALPKSVTDFPLPPLPDAVPAPAEGSDKLPAGLRAAAAAGDPAAAYELGVRYFDGRGVTASAEEAARWLEKAVKAELAPAQFRLGSLYEKGLGLKKDIEAARKLYLASAEKGNAKAMHNLAVLYAEGIEGKPDYRTAAVWFRKGADRGITDSQYNLGILYARGIGVERNMAESFKWFALAAAAGDKESIRKRDEVASRLDPPSLATARQAVESWTAVPQPDEAINVTVPAGGWDQAAATPAKKSRSASPAKTGQ